MDHVRSTTEGNVFSCVCDSIHKVRGVHGPAGGGGGVSVDLQSHELLSPPALSLGKSRMIIRKGAVVGMPCNASRSFLLVYPTPRK